MERYLVEIFLPSMTEADERQPWNREQILILSRVLPGQFSVWRLSSHSATQPSQGSHPVTDHITVQNGWLRGHDKPIQTVFENWSARIP